MGSFSTKGKVSSQAAILSLLYHRTEHTSGGAEALWLSRTGLSLQPIWKARTRRKLRDPSRAEVSACLKPYRRPLSIFLESPERPFHLRDLLHGCWIHRLSGICELFLTLAFPDVSLVVPRDTLPIPRWTMEEKEH